MTYIDNIRFLGDAALTCYKSFKDAAMQCRVTIDDASYACSNEYTFLGVCYKHIRDRVSTCVAMKSLMKLSAFRYEMFPTLTLREVMRWISLMIWVARITSISLSLFYYPLKFLRKRVSAGHELDECANVWESIKAPWWNLHRLLLTNKPKERLAGVERIVENEITIFSDSSLSGWGVMIILPDQRIMFDCGSWNILEHINTLEARALVRALTFLKRLLESDENKKYKNIRLRIFVDNTTVLYGINNEHSRNFSLNVCIQHVEQIIGGIPQCISFQVEYVPSARNIADILTRL